MLIAVKLRALVLHGRVYSLIGYWEKGWGFFPYTFWDSSKWVFTKQLILDKLRTRD